MTQASFCLSMWPLLVKKTPRACFPSVYFFLFLPASGLSCGTRVSCSAACETFVPQPGSELVSCALQGKFLTTGLPGDSSITLLGTT